MRKSVVTLAIGLLIAVLATALSVEASVIVGVDFNEVDTGDVTAAELGTATTGGSWSLNTGRTGGTRAVFDDDSGEGDKALLLDSTSSPANDAFFGTMWFDEAVDLDSLGVQKLDISFETTTSRYGVGKSLQYRLRDSDGNYALQLVWWNDGRLNITDADDTDTTIANISTLQEAQMQDGGNIYWDSTDSKIQTVNISVASGGGYELTWSGAKSGTRSGNLANEVTNINRLEFLSGGANTDAKGMFLNNISVIPEPAGVGLMGFFAGTIFYIRRRFFRK